MKKEEYLSEIRIRIGDDNIPYLFSNEQIEAVIQMACALYSNCRPIKRIGKMQIEPTKTEYALPDDYQIWISGLEDFSVLEKTVMVPCPTYFTIEFIYYADRSLEEIPHRYMPYMIDYCIAELIEKTILNQTVCQEEAQASVLKGLKLGRGLDITYEDTAILKKELYTISRQKKEAFFQALHSKAYGGFY